jgi:hypothetical protein
LIRRFISIYPAIASSRSLQWSNWRTPSSRNLDGRGIKMEIRDATRADAPADCEVLRRRIVRTHHRNDQEILDRWLANKTPEIVVSWIANHATLSW